MQNLLKRWSKELHFLIPTSSSFELAVGLKCDTGLREVQRLENSDGVEERMDTMSFPNK